MNRPTFSVVVPAYNAAETVGDAIRSVLNQTVSDFELIVVDDGSTDSTSAEIERFTGDPRVRHIRQSNRGLAAARNRALDEAHGRYASFLDADDLLLPSYLDAMRRTLERTGAAFAHCDFWILDDATGDVTPWPFGGLELPSDSNELLRVLLRRNLIHYAVTARTEALREVGCFKPELRACEDVELWLRLLAHGLAAARAPGRLCVWRCRPGSLSTQTILMISSLCEVYGLVAEQYDVPEDIRELARARRRTELKRLAALKGERPVAAAFGHIRRAIAARRRPLRGRARRELPPEIAAAFPHLAQSSSV
jgi:hypothetical protein